MYIVVRKDLPSTSQQAVQSAHAGIQATRRGFVKSLAHPILVVLVVDNELELLRFAAHLGNQGILNVVFYEDDLASYTALATECISDPAQRKVFRDMKLLQ